MGVFSGHDTRCLLGSKTISHVEISVCLDDCDGSGSVHVQSQVTGPGSCSRIRRSVAGEIFSLISSVGENCPVSEATGSLLVYY